MTKSKHKRRQVTIGK